MLRVLIVLLILFFAVLQYQIWVPHNGISELLHLRHSISRQKEKNKTLQKENEQLVQKIVELKQGTSSIELLARKKIGLVKRGEVYYQIVEQAAGNKNENSSQ